MHRLSRRFVALQLRLRQKRDTDKICQTHSHFWVCGCRTSQNLKTHAAINSERVPTQPGEKCTDFDLAKVVLARRLLLLLLLGKVEEMSNACVVCVVIIVVVSELLLLVKVLLVLVPVEVVSVELVAVTVNVKGENGSGWIATAATDTKPVVDGRPSACATASKVRFMTLFRKTSE